MSDDSPVRLLAAYLAGAALLSLLAVNGARAANPVADRDLVYANVGGVALKLDLYLPADSTKSAPLLVWIHGGSWQMGNRAFPVADFFTNAGFALASIDYRLTGRAPFPAQIYDCKAAIRWLRANASTYGVDPNRIVAMGHSAGGHLAALLGTTPDDPRLEGSEGVTGVSSRVEAVCDFSGPTDLLTIRSQYLHLPALFQRDPLEALLGGTVGEKAALARLASPALQVNNHACPFFIAHGDKDTVVPVQQSEELNAALTKAGISSTLHIVPGGGHALTDPLVYALALGFLQKQMGL